MIDTHIHLDFESYDNDRQEVIGRFFAEGGKAIINIGTDPERIRKSLEIAHSHDRIYTAIGFHPQEGTDLMKKTGSADFVESLRQYLTDDKVVAMGEIGLDYFHPSASDYDLVVDDKIKQDQSAVFRRQLELASEYKLPVCIHFWDSHDDGWEILKDYPDLKIVLHCYGRGLSLEFTEKLLTHGNVHFSFTGNVTFPRPGKAGSEIWDHIKHIPLERIMVETDGPFLSPAPHRGKRNEPAYVRYVIEKIAQIKNLPPEEVEKATDENAVRFFNLSLPD